MSRVIPVTCLAMMSAVTFGQSKSLSQGPNRMELTLERKGPSGWSAVDPGFVFRQNDQLRFRFKTNFSGTLYVMNHGTSGSYVRLFPTEDAGTENLVEAGKEYMVPATEGAFRVDGPAGYDVLYWVMAPATEQPYQPLPPPPAKEKALGSLRPRCDNSILRARGECVDSTAGAQPLTRGQQVPPNLKSVPQENSRQLVFMKEQDQSVVSSPAPLSGPVVYEFRLAHR